MGLYKREKTWTVDLKSPDGIRRRIAAFPGKRASEELAHKLEILRDCRLAGNSLSSDIRKWLETIPHSMQERLTVFGFLDRKESSGNKPLYCHLDDFYKALLSKGNTGRYCKEKKAAIYAIISECRFKYYSQITASKVREYITSLKEAGRSARTCNVYLKSFKEFCKWLIKDGRAFHNPIEHISTMNTKADRRIIRRALTYTEICLLINSAYNGNLHHGMTGFERAMLYRLALETGLRWSELRSLKKISFNLNVTTPTVTIEAKSSKNRNTSVIPLKRDTANDFESYLLYKLPVASVFSMWKDKGAEMLRVDLKAAKIPYTDDSGRVADFHSLRHTFISNLAASGVHPKKAQELARHSDINLTMNTYTHTVIENQAEAVASLPDLSFSGIEEIKKTGTDDKSESPSEACAISCAISPHNDRIASDNTGNMPLNISEGTEALKPLICNEKALKTSSLQGLINGGQYRTRTCDFLLVRRQVDDKQIFTDKELTSFDNEACAIQCAITPHNTNNFDILKGLWNALSNDDRGMVIKYIVELLAKDKK